MGFASSSAARAEPAPMFGNLGSPGGERKLKKKPVLVLDPEEMAKAHQLFQIGGAEQMGDFDPQQRPAHTAPMFGSALGNVLAAAAISPDDDDDDYQPPFALADEDDAPDEDLPPIDLEAILALTGAEQAAEDAFYAEDLADEPASQAAPEPDAAWELAAPIVSGPMVSGREPLPEPVIAQLPMPAQIEPVPAATEYVCAVQLPAEAEQASEPETQPPSAPVPAPSEALARIISRAAALPLPELAPAPEPEPEPAPEYVPEPEPEYVPEPNFVPEPEPESVTSQPVTSDEAWIVPAPSARDAFEEAEPIIEMPEAIAIVPMPEPLDLIEHAVMADDDYAESETPHDALPIFESGPRSELRARLVREDLTFARPEPSAWRKFMIAVRRLWWAR